MKDIVRQLEDEGITYKRESKITTVYLIDGDKVGTKEMVCDVITVGGVGEYEN